VIQVIKTVLIAEVKDFGRRKYHKNKTPFEKMTVFYHKRETSTISQ